MFFRLHEGIARMVGRVGAVGGVKSADVITSIGIDDFLEEVASNFANR